MSRRPKARPHDVADRVHEDLGEQRNEESFFLGIARGLVAGDVSRIVFLAAARRRFTNDVDFARAIRRFARSLHDEYLMLLPSKTSADAWRFVERACRRYGKLLAAAQHTTHAIEIALWCDVEALLARWQPRLRDLAEDLLWGYRDNARLTREATREIAQELEDAASQAQVREYDGSTTTAAEAADAELLEDIDAQLQVARAPRPGDGRPELMALLYSLLYVRAPGFFDAVVQRVVLSYCANATAYDRDRAELRAQRKAADAAHSYDYRKNKRGPLAWVGMIARSACIEIQRENQLAFEVPPAESSTDVLVGGTGFEPGPISIAGIPGALFTCVEPDRAGRLLTVLRGLVRTPRSSSRRALGVDATGLGPKACVERVNDVLLQVETLIVGFDDRNLKDEGVLRFVEFVRRQQAWREFEWRVYELLDEADALRGRRTDGAEFFDTLVAAIDIELPTHAHLTAALMANPSSAAGTGRIEDLLDRIETVLAELSMLDLEPNSIGLVESLTSQVTRMTKLRATVERVAIASTDLRTAVLCYLDRCARDGFVGDPETGTHWERLQEFVQKRVPAGRSCVLGIPSKPRAIKEEDFAEEIGAAPNDSPLRREEATRLFDRLLDHVGLGRTAVERLASWSTVVLKMSSVEITLGHYFLDLEQLLLDRRIVGHS